MGYFTNYVTDIQNIKVDDFPEFGTLAGFFIVPRGHEFATETLARAYANWETLMQAVKQDRLYPINGLYQFNDASEETTMADGITGKVFVKSGTDSYELTFNSSPYRHSTLKSQEGVKGVYLFDVEGNIKGMSYDGVKMQSIPAKIVVGNHKVNNGTDPGRTTMTISFENTNLMHKYPAVLSDLDFKPQDFEGLKTVNLSVATPTTTGAVISVIDKFSGAGAQGITTTDFLIKNGSGVVQAFTATDNEDGTYTFVWTITSGTYTATLKNSYDMATKGYEASAPVSFTVS